MRNEGCVMKTVCPLVDTCGLMAMVSEGRVVRIKGDPGHSIMREFIDKNSAVTKYPHASAYPGGVMIGPRLCSFTESSCGSVATEICCASLCIRARCFFRLGSTVDPDPMWSWLTTASLSGVGEGSAFS